MKTIGIKINSRCRLMTYTALLSAAIFTILLLPAYGQQEVDPTWYDPSPAANAATVSPAQPTAAVQSAQAVSSRSPDSADSQVRFSCSGCGQDSRKARTA